MSHLNTISKRCSEVQNLLAENKISIAAKRLMDFVRDFSNESDHLNEVIAIHATAVRLLGHERKNTLSFNELETNYNRLLFRMLMLMDTIQAELRNNYNSY